MGTFEKDDLPMLSPSYPQSDENDGFQNRRFVYRTRSASLSMPMGSINSFENDSSFVGYTGPLRSERQTSLVQMSGPLYIGREPENSFPPAPAAVVHKPTLPTTENYPSISNTERNGWRNNDYTGKNEHLLKSGQLGMCSDPYCTTCPTYYPLKARQRNSKSSDIFDHRFRNVMYGDAKGWAKRTCSFLHPYIPGVMNPHTKIVQKWNKFFVISFLCAVFIDPLFFFLLYVQQENKCTVLNWPLTTTIVILRSITDIIYLMHILLQFRLAYVAPESRVVGAGDLVDHPKKIAINYLLGYFAIDFFIILPLPQIIMLLIFPKAIASSGANFAEILWRAAILLQYITSHVVGSCWYLFGLQQISTLAGNQVPSYFLWEVIFTMATIGMGLVLFALLVGNMQNFLQSLDRRRLEMSLRRRDVEQWMSHRRLPVALRRQVREAERYNWAATRGVNEEMLLENLPEDLQRDIRRYLFKFIKKVRIFTLLDEPIIDAICERLRQKTYIAGSKVLYRGGLVDKMVFVIRGKMESIGEDGNVASLCEGDVCGEELLTWCLEHSSINRDGKKIRIPGHRLLSNRLVRCLTNVEAFILRASDLEEVTNLFARFLRSPRVQGALRYESPYWRGLAGRRIQVAWRYRKKRQSRADSSSPQH
ncbi:probable cyclic nucleotide-gated ion channel 20, chloroplastic isoform X5 [Lycium barbarum]|uniref:probable cyclic nucleotide-gated ion channel 20, chloroplastic isoform X5 n=1 Tax=Lycium barbarum TaxID=112863 RepID=UPI00293F4EFF|nr:probable cyclic nucleotide-gated ion channel 20, chloroplastic isoform X5 [Lycium barbarum]